MNAYIRDMDETDPIAIMMKLENFCNGANSAVVQQVRQRILNVHILAGESSTDFVTSFNLIMEDAYKYQINMSEQARIDLLLEGLRGSYKV